MRALPPLSALPAFEATARLGSVTAAADELGRTHSAVSKQLTRLAQDLGGDLFRKQGNGLALTDRGARLQQQVGPMLRDLSDLAQGMRADRDAQHVDIVIGATLATRWLMGRLPDFYARHPQIEVRLRMSGAARPAEHEFDIQISYDRLRGLPLAPDTRALGDTSYGVVCAPDYPLRQQGRGYQADTRLTQAHSGQSWQAWQDLTGHGLQTKREVIHPHHMLALEAAAAGLGVALAEHRLVAQDLAQGRLIAPLGFVTVPGGFKAVVTPRATRRPAAGLLLDWLARQVAEARVL